MTIGHAIANFLGLTNGSGVPYLFWSGVGSDLTEFAIVAVLWHKINCPVKGCWRPGLRKVPGTDHVVCRRHHPKTDLSHQDVLDAHQEASGDRA